MPSNGQVFQLEKLLLEPKQLASNVPYVLSLNARACITTHFPPSPNLHTLTQRNVEPTVTRAQTNRLNNRRRHHVVGSANGRHADEDGVHDSGVGATLVNRLAAATRSGRGQGCVNHETSPATHDGRGSSSDEPQSEAAGEPRQADAFLKVYIYNCFCY